jgi:hypothetical protein
MQVCRAAAEKDQNAGGWVEQPSCRSQPKGSLDASISSLVASFSSLIASFNRLNHPGVALGDSFGEGMTIRRPTCEAGVAYPGSTSFKWGSNDELTAEGLHPVRSRCRCTTRRPAG